MLSPQKIDAEMNKRGGGYDAGQPEQNWNNEKVKDMT